MTRLFIFVFFTISLVITSCDNNEASTREKTSTEERQLKYLVEQYPDSLALRSRLVDYFANKNDYPNAIRETNLLIEKDSNNADQWDAKARLLFLNGDTTGAINALQRAIQISPAPNYAVSLATVYAQTRNPEAISTANSLLNSSLPGIELRAWFIKGLYYNYSGDEEKAIPLFDSCLQLDYTFMDAYREKAIALYQSGKYEEALKVLEKATSVQRLFDEGYYWMGRCYEQLHKKIEAVNNYRLALQIDPNYQEAKDALEKLGSP